MSFGNNNKQLVLNQLVWIGISFGISITISMLVPFPVSLFAIFGVFIMLNIYMRRREEWGEWEYGGRRNVWFDVWK
jgi:predicted alpha/beta hydrolase